MAREHFYPLDVLRFFAAFAVAAYHLCFNDWASDYSTASFMLDDTARFEPLAPFAWFGWIGVEVFFVISGFVIANSAYGASPMTFLKGRMLRLYPAAWVCATIALAAWIVLAQEPVSDMLARYSRSMALWIRGPWIDGVYWSLAVEIVFYALVFVSLIFGRVFRVTQIPWLLTGLSLFYTLTHIFPRAAAAVLTPHVIERIEWYSEVSLMRYGAYFAIGIWLWLMNRRAMNALRFTGLALAILLGAYDIAWRAGHFQAQVSYVSDYPAWPPLTVWFAALALIAAVARVPAAFAVRSPLRQAVLKRIGLMTYPLFLVHGVLGAGLLRVLVTEGIDPWIALFVAMATPLALAYVICATAEVGIRRAMRGALDKVEGLVRHAPALGFLFAARSEPLIATRGAH